MHTTELNGIFCMESGHGGTPWAGCSHNGIQRVFYYGIQPPRDSPGGIQPRRDSTGFFLWRAKLYSSSSRAGRCGHRKTIRSCRPDTHGLLAFSMRCCLDAAGAATSSLATASLVSMLCWSGPCVCHLPRDRMPLGSLISEHKRKGFIWGFASLYWG